MSLRTFVKQSISLLVGGLLMLILIKGTSLLQASTPLAAVTVPTTAIVQDALASLPVLSYQGRLLDPTTGAPKPDGSYTIQFKLYTVATGGTPLWSESLNVTTSKGLFTAMLGAVTPLESSQFNGNTLYLGVSISSDPEASPRQAIGDVAYAIFARNADKVDGKDATSFAPTTHTHDGAAINAGIVGEPHIATAITRDNEVMGIVQANGGSGSNIDADHFDGNDSSIFAKTYSGIQVDRTVALAAGAQESWSTFGYAIDQLVVWRVQPTTIGAIMRLQVDQQLDGNGDVAYFLYVTNTGSIASGYHLIRQTFYQ